jgi:uncharacterized protein (DUF2235 family)
MVLMITVIRDTVSSIGIVRGKILPLTDSCRHICFFWHALALDEWRVKFLPECIMPLHAQAKEGTLNNTDTSDTLLPPKVKEVWFAGSHLDV